MDVIRILAALILPPLGVFLQEGIRKRFWINVLLTVLGYIPGIIHAVYVIVKYEPTPRVRHVPREEYRASRPSRPSGPYHQQHRPVS